jgi:hypothetical protein
MHFSRRSAIWAIPIIFGFFESRMIHASGFSDSALGNERFQSAALKGAQALKENKPDSAMELFMEAHRMGMSKDSLFYFLAEAALSHSAFDTAMTFNLAITPARQGAFRETVLGQRFRLYKQTGLERDAEALLDSMSEPPAGPAKRNHELNVAISSGYFGEDNYPAKDYPFGTDLGGFRSFGPQFRHRAQLLWPLFQSGGIPWSGGLEYDVIKSYAKDSLDYRAGLRLKADNLFKEGVSLSLTSEFGNVTGTGVVSSYKLEASFLSFSEMNITLIQAGVESELNGDFENRFSGFWISFYQDRSLRTGWGFNYSVSVSGIIVDPIGGASVQKVMYVDDVTKPKPVHYRDAAFQDTLPGKGISTFLQYTSNTGTYQSSTNAPQGFATMLPTLGYGFPLPFSFSGELGGLLVLNFYPDAYAWEEAALPAGLETASAGFRGFALNKADGRHYAALLVQENGGFQEHYGATPLSEERKARVDAQLGADISIRRRFSTWGSLTLDGVAKRNWSSLEGVTPIWIPRWDIGAALKWSRGWTW